MIANDERPIIDIAYSVAPQLESEAVLFRETQYSHRSRYIFDEEDDRQGRSRGIPAEYLRDRT